MKHLHVHRMEIHDTKKQSPLSDSLPSSTSNEKYK